MNKLVKAQLEKVQFADLSHYDSDKNEYFIPKRSDIKLEKYKEYLIELSDKCFDKNSYININWNKGKIPNSKFYHGEIVDISGKVIHISGIAYDIDNSSDLASFWDGYIPIDGLTVLKCL